MRHLVLLALGLTMLMVRPGLAVPDWATQKRAGDEAVAHKDYRKAIEIFEGLVRYYPEKADGFNALGFSYFMSGDHERAIYAFRQALSRNPYHPAAQHNLILAVTERALLQCKELEYMEAESGLKNILASYPYHPEAASVYFLLAKVQFFRGDETGGLANLREVARRVPQSATARFVQGWDLEQQGRLNEAAAAYQQAVKKLPDEPVFRNYYARALARKGKSEDAVAQLRAALKDRELPYIDLRINLVRLLLGLGQTEQALEELRQAQAQRPDYGSLFLWMSALLASRGDSAGAQRELALALARDQRPGLIVSPDSGGARASLDGQDLGSCPAAAFASPGKHKLRVKVPGAADQVLALDLVPGTITRIQGAAGNLTATESPGPAEVGNLAAAPDFVLKDRNNRRWRIFRHLNRKPIVLLFWRAGAGQDALLEDLSGLCDRYSIEGAAIHVDPQRGKQALTAYLSRPATFAQLSDEGSVARLYAATLDQPLVVLIDVDGFIASRGGDIWSLEPTIRRMLGLPGDRP